MTPQTYGRAEDFDHHGRLRVPALFWLAVLLQTRAWWLTGLEIVAGSDLHLMAVCYPDTGMLMAGLAAGLPAAALLFVYPVRGEMPVLARAGYLLLLAAVCLQLLMDVDGLFARQPHEPVALWLMLCADLVCGVVLWPDRRLRAVFFRRAYGGGAA
ncbi:DUF2919 domain-containing protein [Salmonella enterica]|nr:DUF2919 domain-containing protein [Salmonella enterica]